MNAGPSRLHRLVSQWTGIAACLAWPSLAQAQQPPFLVADINARNLSPASWPAEFTRLGSDVYFAATTLADGRELFKTRGLHENPNTTDLFYDIAPGGLNSNPLQLTAVGALLYFTADDGVSGRELWRSDGTFAGTFRLRDIHPAGTSSPEDLTAHAGRLYFTADDGTHGRELWTSDGTSAGTVLVHDLIPGGATSAPAHLLSHGARLYFVATDPAFGREVWSSDGASAGTTRVTDIVAGSGNANPSALYSIGTRVVFVATTPATGNEVWSTDGSAGGTQLLGDFEPGPNPSFASLFQVVGNRLTFFARYRELWSTDGTPVGTTLIAGGLGYPQLAESFGNALIFTMRELSGNGSALWRCDGTAASLQRLSSGWLSHGITELTTIGSTLWFQGTTTTTANQGALWKTDGTAAGTVRVATIHRQWPYRGGGPLGFCVCANGRVVFSADDGDHGREPWVTDGTSAGTVMLRDLGLDLTRTFASAPRQMIDLLGTTLLVADDGIHGEELWRSDGTVHGTRLVRDIYPGPQRSFLLEWVRVGDRIFFTADDGTHGYELWVSDGTTAGTRLVIDLLPGSASSGVAYLTEFRGTVCFAAHDGVFAGVWRSDGTAGGTQRLANIQAEYLRAAGEKLYFAGEDLGVGNELWCSDGTPFGTRLLVDLDPTITSRGPASSSPHEFLEWNGAVYFVASHTNYGFGDLWKTDGTPGGTQLVARIVQGGLATAHTLTARTNRLFFIVSELPAQRSLLWISDGSAAGTSTVTTRVQDVRSLVPLGDRVVMRGRNFLESEVWISDGTDQGTQLVADLNGSASSDPGTLVPIGSRRIIFSAFENATGQEPWITDGTASGTRRIADLAAFPSSSSSRPHAFTLSRGRVLFAADDGALGEELWSYFPGATAAPLGDGCALQGRAPRLHATDPVLGQASVFRSTDAPNGALALLLVSNAPIAPFVQLGSCALYLDLPTTFVVTTLVQPSAEWSLSIPVPNGGHMIGVRAVAQVAYVLPQAALALTNALDLTFGL